MSSKSFSAKGGMKQSSKDERRWKLLDLLARSQAARSIIGKRRGIEEALAARRRRLWPLATVARLFGISPGLLRKWATAGMVSLFQRPTDRHRPGLTPRAIRRFLEELAGGAEGGIEMFPHRPRPAEERCREAMRGLKEGELLDPVEFAARAGVSVTTVRRLVTQSELHTWRPTPHRPKICCWPEKDRRNRLTRKQAKNRR